MRSSVSIAAFAAAAALVCAPLAAGAEAYHLVLARSDAEALFIWNASPVVARIVSERLRDDEANERLERIALQTLARSISAVQRPARITLRVLYDKVGARSPVYGEPAFAGVERYAVLTLDGTSAVRDRDRWWELGPHAEIPRWIDFRVVGKLPNR